MEPKIEREGIKTTTTFTMQAMGAEPHNRIYSFNIVATDEASAKSDLVADLEQIIKDLKA